ncbi:MAG: 4'-phosphopantetheinyl transferase superfamily protein [Eubacteriales bacterium]|nr:4'-phosphopantetheinyl transferase superfamily protein [Eubacteriales bacterium]
MFLYLFQSDKKDGRQNNGEQKDRSAFSERLVRKALRDYSERQLLELPPGVLSEAVIVRTKKGKPFFSGLPAVERDGEEPPAIYFSVSHSGNRWGCLMAAEPVGFDLEVIREGVHYMEIAQRFFTEEECEWIVEAGADAFFDVWVRKEAYVKYLGTGLAEGLDSFSVVGSEGLSPKVILKKSGTGNQLHGSIGKVEIDCGIKAAYCSGSGVPVKAVIDLVP